MSFNHRVKSTKHNNPSMVSAFCFRRRTKNSKLQLYPALKQNKLTIFLTVEEEEIFSNGHCASCFPLSFPVITLVRIVSLPYLPTFNYL